MPRTIDPAQVTSAIEAAAYLRDEADFNRSWTDGRRSGPGTPSAGYVARRIEAAEQRDRWAAAIEVLLGLALPVPG
jgi:hypothetical protein